MQIAKGENHMAENQYKCEVCGATFNTEAEWEKHNRIKHALYTCENCRQTFNKEDEFAAHNFKMHPELQKFPR
jgi:transposase-like protein